MKRVQRTKKMEVGKKWERKKLRAEQKKGVAVVLSHATATTATAIMAAEERVLVPGFFWGS